MVLVNRVLMKARPREKCWRSVSATVRGDSRRLPNAVVVHYSTKHLGALSS